MTLNEPAELARESSAQPAVDPGVLLRPAHSSNAFEETVQRLLQSIRLGLIAPGSRLPAERELAVMLAISRDTLRDAIAALAQAGYVEARRGRYGGTFVVSVLPSTTPVVDRHGDLTQRAVVPPQEVEDALLLRRVLEVGAARQAAEAPLRPADHERLRQAHRECRDAEPEDYRRLDARLHLLVAELVGSPSLTPLVAQVRMRINELLDRIPLLEPNLVHSDAQHEEIVEAIIHGRPAAAAEAMQAHIAGSEALLRGFLA